MTSWRTSASISAIRATSKPARSRMTRTASAGIRPRSASTSQTTSSTSSQRWKRPSSDQMARIAGRE